MNNLKMISAIVLALVLSLALTNTARAEDDLDKAMFGANQVQGDDLDDIMFGTSKWQDKVKDLDDLMFGAIQDSGDLDKDVFGTDNKVGGADLDADYDEKQRLIAEAKERERQRLAKLERERKERERLARIEREKQRIAQEAREEAERIAREAREEAERIAEQAREKADKTAKANSSGGFWSGLANEFVKHAPAVINAYQGGQGYSGGSSGGSSGSGGCSDADQNRMAARLEASISGGNICTVKKAQVTYFSDLQAAGCGDLSAQIRQARAQVNQVCQ